MSAVAQCWVIYCNPDDYASIRPEDGDVFVVRRFEDLAPKELVGDPVFTIEEARAKVPCGTIRFARDATDAFSIVETWL